MPPKPKIPLDPAKIDIQVKSADMNEDLQQEVFDVGMWHLKHLFSSSTPR
jgi:hypothetical protein